MTALATKREANTLMAALQQWQAYRDHRKRHKRVLATMQRWRCTNVQVAALATWRRVASVRVQHREALASAAAVHETNLLARVVAQWRRVAHDDAIVRTHPTLAASHCDSPGSHSTVSVACVVWCLPGCSVVEPSSPWTVACTASLNEAAGVHGSTPPPSCGSTVTPRT